MGTRTVQCTLLVLVGLAAGARAGDVPGDNPAKAPPGGVLLSDLTQLSAASLMQATPPPKPLPPLWTLKGFAEFAYTWNFNKPRNIITLGPPDAKENNFRVFDVNHNEFSVHAVTLDAEKAATEDSPVGFRVVATAGQDAKWIHSAGLFDRPPSSGVAIPGGGEDFDLIDAYLTLKIPEKHFPWPTTFKIGKWETHHGAEVIHSPYNDNYSRSYLFGLAIPFTHTGVMMDTTWAKRPGSETEMFGTGLGIVNGWDNVKDNNNDKSYMIQARFSPGEAFETHAEAMFGPEQTEGVGSSANWRGLLDLNATLRPTPWAPGLDGLSITGNFDLGWEDGANALTGGYAKWYGLAGYLRYDLGVRTPLKKWYLGLRGEFFNDPEGARTGFIDGAGTDSGAKFMEITGTLGYRPWESLLLRFEYRYDKADHDVFEKRGGTAAGLPNTNNQNTLAVDVIVFF